MHAQNGRERKAGYKKIGFVEAVEVLMPDVLNGEQPIRNIKEEQIQQVIEFIAKKIEKIICDGISRKIRCAIDSRKKSVYVEKLIKHRNVEKPCVK